MKKAGEEKESKKVLYFLTKLMMSGKKSSCVEVIELNRKTTTKKSFTFC